MSKLLITRPLEQAQDLAEDLKQRGIESLTAPMLTITPVLETLPDLTNYSGLIFTSANALNAINWKKSGVNKDIPVFTVGSQTAESAKNWGFQNIFNADGDAADLADVILKTNTGNSAALLYLRGAHTSTPLEDILKTKGCPCESIIVYEAHKAEILPQDCKQALIEKQISAVCFFSARTAETFEFLIKKEGLEETLKPIKALCISNKVLGSLNKNNWNAADVSEHPNRDAMIRLICQNDKV